MSIQPADALRGFRESPFRRLRCEMYCFWLTLVPHSNNNDVRKLGTVLIILVWAVIEVGASFDVATVPDEFLFIRVFVGVVVGRMWGIEINNFAGIEFDGGNNGDD